MSHQSIIQSTLAIFLIGAMSAALTGFSAAATSPTSDGRTDDPRVYSYNVDAAHSEVSFKVRHLGIANVTGFFRVYDVQLSVNPHDLTSLRTEAVISVASIDTGNHKRDDHLRSADFFDVANHESITFVSREVRNIDGSQFELVGDLTIRGTTREVVLDSELVGTAVGAMGEPRVGFAATGKISRKDFGLTWNRLTEAGGIIVGDEVTMVLEVQAAQL